MANWTIPQNRKKWPLVMGVLNVTPDSFSDGGRFVTTAMAMHQVEQMVNAGVDMIDVGGESTRPGAAPVSADDEMHRVLPVIEAIRRSFDVPVSIDTTKAKVMQAAVDTGANMINDVTALADAESLRIAGRCQVPVCLMHMQGSPRTMQNHPEYNNVVTEVRDYLRQRVAACVAAGIPASQIVVDPGFGFGKTLAHNLQLFQSLPQVADGQPLLVGVSRKSMIGQVLDKPVNERQVGSLALVALATWQQAAIVRVHDVAESLDVVRMIRAVRDVEYTAPASSGDGAATNTTGMRNFDG